MATYSQQQANFIATELPYAQRESKRTGIPVSVFLAQSAWETGWGTSYLFTKENNPAGIGAYDSSHGGAWPSLSAAFRTYADKLMGVGEAGQGRFVADVKAGADPNTLLTDLEQGPWAASHYGYTNLNREWASTGLGAFDAPGATAPTGSTPIHTVDIIMPGPIPNIPAPGPDVHANPGYYGGKAASGVAGAVIGPLLDFVKAFAIRSSLVVFGAIAILVGLALLVRDASQDRSEDKAGEEAGREERAAQREEGPTGASESQPNVAPASSSAGGSSSTSSSGGAISSKAVEGDVESTAEAAPAALA